MDMPVDDYLPKTSDIALRGSGRRKLRILAGRVDEPGNHVSGWGCQRDPELGRMW
jgi:hypothetical protein